MTAPALTWPLVLLWCLGAAVASWALTWPVLRVLTRKGIVDTPNARSSHDAPTPRGGGLALIPVILVSWLAVDLGLGLGPSRLPAILFGATALAALGWLDDLRGLPAAPRLLAQAVAVAIGLYALDGLGPVFQGLLPPVLDRLAAGLVWLWFVNLFNFMDGIDGITGVEVCGICLGLVLVQFPVLGPDTNHVLPALLGAATLGFLAWNWPPAKLFLGDVGSVPLGYLLGFLLLILAIRGHWPAALILPLYYLADATITLARRAGRGAKVWQAHKEHFYQRAARGGAGHARVSLALLMCNLLLIACALSTVNTVDGGNPWPGLAAAVAVVAGFVFLLRRWAGQR